MSPRTQLRGPALVKLKSGIVIEGHAVYDNGTVHVTGRVRVVSLVDGESRVSYRARGRWTLSMRRVDHIVWRPTGTFDKMATPSLD